MRQTLRRLVLAGQFQHLESDAYKALGHTPITTLAVGKKSDISATALTALLGEKGLCPTIKTMRIDNLSATAPRHALQQGVFHLFQTADDPHAVLNEFVLPQWTTAFTSGKSHELKQAAEEAGVKIKGSVLDAMKVQAEYDSLEEMVIEWEGHDDYSSSWDGDECG